LVKQLYTAAIPHWEELAPAVVASIVVRNVILQRNLPEYFFLSLN